MNRYVFVTNDGGHMHLLKRMGEQEFKDIKPSDLLGVPQVFIEVHGLPIVWPKLMHGVGGVFKLQQVHVE